MAVFCGAFSVIVRNSTIEARFPGGMEAFGLARPNGTFCTDGQISRIGFAVEADARFFVSRLVAAGIASTEGATGEIAVLVEGEGSLHPYDWLQVGLLDGRPAAWLAGSDRGNLFIAQCDLGGSPMIAISYQELRESWEFLGMDGKLEAYRHKLTGQTTYIARPFHAAPSRKWWQFWK